MIDGQEFQRILAAVKAAGHGDDIEWSESIEPPDSAVEFASEAIFVIANSGMHHRAGRSIYLKSMAQLRAGEPVWDVFKHPGKVAAIEEIWRNREELYLDYLVWSAAGPEKELEFCARLPWIGGITKYHLAKNFGANVAKPDRHLQRLADREGITPQALCDRLAAESGLRAATVDVVLWRACAIGIIRSRS